ncbi:MAG: Rieske 2Fe-2S domain-containing protein, partial [Flavipsychrobacter sp.]
LAVILIPEVIGFVLMSIAGWLGGTLVYRNQIGVDPRYAGAGKWKEAHLDVDGNRVEVCKADELKTDQMKLIHIKGQRIVIARTEDAYVAFDDQCSHKGGSLAGGSMICGTVQCPWHGSQFSVVDGQVKAGPAKESIKTYKTEEANGAIYLVL